MIGKKYFLISVILLALSAVGSGIGFAADEPALRSRIIESAGKGLSGYDNLIDLSKMLQEYRDTYKESRFNDDISLLYAYVLNKLESPVASGKILEELKNRSALLVDDEMLPAFGDLPGPFIQTDVMTYIVYLDSENDFKQKNYIKAASGYEAAIERMKKISLVSKPEQEMFYLSIYHLAESLASDGQISKARGVVWDFLNSKRIVSEEYNKNMRELLKVISTKYVSQRNPFMSPADKEEAQRKQHSTMVNASYSGKQRNVAASELLYLTGIINEKEKYAIFSYKNESFVKKLNDSFEGFILIYMSTDKVKIKKLKDGTIITLHLGEGKFI